MNELEVTFAFLEAEAKKARVKQRQLKQLRQYLGEQIRDVVPLFQEVFDYCEVNKIPIVRWENEGVMVYRFPWRKPLFEMLERIYSDIPRIVADKDLFDQISLIAEWSFVFRHPQHRDAQVWFKLDGMASSSTCRLERTEIKREVSATVYNVICQDEVVGEQLKIE